MRPALAWAGSDSFRCALDRAAIGWAVISAGWFLPRALDGDPPPAEDAMMAVPRRSSLLHRLAQAIPAAEKDDLPAVTSTLRELHACLARLWITAAASCPGVPLILAVFLAVPRCSPATAAPLDNATGWTILLLVRKNRHCERLYPRTGTQIPTTISDRNSP